MKTLYNNYHATNEDGKTLTNECEIAIEPIIAKWFAAGYSPAEIESIITSVVTVKLGEEKLIFATKAQKEKNLCA